MKRVLITGGKGLIGSWVVKDLLKKGFTPVVYDLGKAAFRLPDLYNHVHVIDGNVLDSGHVESALSENRIDTVIHTAAITNLEKAQSHPDEVLQLNCQGTLNVLEASRKAGIKRVIYTSSRGVFGHIDDDRGYPTYRPVTENYRIKPYTIYGATKFFSECLGMNYARMYGLEFCALRFSMIYGPGKRTTHGSGAFHSVLIEESLLGNPVSVPKGGDEKDDLIYVRDVSQAIVRAALAPKVNHKVYNIGIGVASTPRDFAQAVGALIPQSQIQIGSGLDYLNRGYANYCIFDITRARVDLGYKPEYDLLRGIQDYIDILQRMKNHEAKR